MKKYKVYSLEDPTTRTIRYVGRTSQSLDNRLQRHLRAMDKSHRVNWINGLKELGLVPTIRLICETDNFDYCNEMEQFYIKKFKEQGFNLVNLTEGGEGSVGFKHTSETKNKISEAARKRVLNSEYIETLRTKGLKRWSLKTPDEQLQNIVQQPTRRCIGQYDLDNNFINEFLSLREIERTLGFFRANISPCLKGIYKQAYGFKWKYLD